jgi:hypothetical protein
MFTGASGLALASRPLLGSWPAKDTYCSIAMFGSSNMMNLDTVITRRRDALRSDNQGFSCLGFVRSKIAKLIDVTRKDVEFTVGRLNVL